MRALNPSEKRTIRLGAIGIAIYLALFGGVKVWQFLSHQRAAYLQLVREAANLKNELQPYDDKIEIVQKLMQDYRLDPASLARPAVVADASAALQKAAASGGVQVGPIHESPARTSAKDLGSIQFEGTGQVPAIMAFLHNVQRLGYPLIVDSLQITADPMRPDRIKLNLTIIVQDFDQWKKKEAAHA